MFGRRDGLAAHPVSDPAARRVIQRDQMAGTGTGTGTLPNAPALFQPLTASQ